MGKGLTKTIDAVRKSELAPFALAGALFWSWLDLGAFNTLLLGASGATDGLAGLSSLVASAASTIPLLLAAMLARNLDSFMGKPAPLIATAAAGGLGTLGISAGGTSGLVPLVVASSIAQGCVLGSFSLIIVIAACRARSAFKMGVLVSSSVVLGMLVDGLLLALQETYLVIAIALLPVLCALCSHRAVRNGRSTAEAVENERPRQSLRKPLMSHRGLFAFIVAFSFMHGFLQYFSTASASWMDPDGMLLLVARGAAMIAVLLLLCAKHIRIDVVLRAGIVVSLLGFTLISDSFFLPDIRDAGVFAAAAGYACFDVIAWSLLAEIALCTPRTGARVVSFGVFVWQTGALLGTGAGFASEAASLPDAMTGLLVSFVAFCIVGAGVHFMGSEFWIAVKYDDPQRAGGGASATPLEAVAARFLLTKREAEMLSYLLKGRTVPYIAEAECISENTVRSHMKNIYAKLGVHTRQELIDIVEAEKLPTRIM